MAAPVYTTDLTDINLAEGDTWVEMDGHKGGSDPIFEQDYYIQGTGCVSQATGGSTGTAAGIMYDNTANISGFQTGDVFLIWQILLAGNDIYPFGQGGMRFYVGHASQNWNGFQTAGDNFGRNPYGGWFNAAVDPTFVNSDGSPDYTEGTPNAGQYRYFASLPNLRAAISKGNPHGVDALRWGRGALIVSAGDASDPATFEGMALENDEQDNRWGLFQQQPGTILWKGLIQFGTGHNSVNSVYFNDSNVNITVDDTPRTYKEFNKIEIRNQNSTVLWDSVQISSLSPTGGLLSPGRFEVIDDANVQLENCTFTDLDTFKFLSNSDLNTTTWRRCSSVEQNSAEFTSCIFDSHRPSAANPRHAPETTFSVAAVSANDLDLIQYCQFISAERQGRHAISCNVSGSYDFYGNLFDGFGASGTPSAAFYNNSGGDITLNVLDGGDSPTVYNAPDGSRTYVVVAVSYTLTGIVSGSEVQIVTQSGETPLYHLENTTEDDGSGRGTTQATYSYSYSVDLGGTDTPIYIYIHNVNYKWRRIIDTLTSNDKSVPISQEADPWYNNP